MTSYPMMTMLLSGTMPFSRLCRFGRLQLRVR
jgi:hypothetical protein